jgi:glycerol-3-phosphate dehydrogenase
MGGEEIHVKPKVVINAGGPWIDFVNHAMGKDSQFIGGTKGSHLILNHPELKEAIGDHEVFFENKDGRIVLIFPLMDKVMIGSSDIRIKDPDNVCITEEEIDYFFEMLDRVFPTIKVDKSHIVYTFSGVRPLPYSGEDYTGNISRNHSIETIVNFPIYSLVGGKWTSFRAFSEQTCDKTLGYLGKERKIQTTNLAIGGGKDYPHSEAEKEVWFTRIKEQSGIDQERLTVLFDRYGTRAEEVAKFISQDKDAPLTHLPNCSRREIEYILTQEEVNHLDDLILRRTMIAKLGNLTPELLDELAKISGEVLCWKKSEVEEEIRRTVKILAEKHRIEFNKYIT